MCTSSAHGSQSAWPQGLARVPVNFEATLLSCIAPRWRTSPRPVLRLCCPRFMDAAMTKPWRTVPCCWPPGCSPLLMVLSAVAGPVAGFKHEQGIELLEWQGLRLSSGGNLGSACAMRRTRERPPSWLPVPPASPCRLPSFFARCRLVRCKSTSLAGDSLVSARRRQRAASNGSGTERWAAWLPQTDHSRSADQPALRQGTLRRTGGAEVRAEGRIVARRWTAA